MNGKIMSTKCVLERDKQWELYRGLCTTEEEGWAQRGGRECGGHEWALWNLKEGKAQMRQVVIKLVQGMINAIVINWSS